MEDLDRRIRLLRTSRDTDAVIELGCDLVEAGRGREAEDCFRRAAELGAPLGWFNLGNALAARGAAAEAVDAYERALAGGESDAWLNLGLVLEDLGDLAGAERAFRGAGAAGDPAGLLELAFLLREQGETDEAAVVAAGLARTGHETAAAVLASWRWAETRDPALEAELRAGAGAFPATRTALAALLRDGGRTAEARWFLECGAKLGERESWLPLGNLYVDDLGDVESAEEAYRAGLAAGDPYCHHNLAVLLAGRGDLDGAIEHLRLGAAEGDELAARTLADLEG
ncbi:tetratricopeptide repeat protein [Geodermatophilus sp. SYSU D00758]